MILRKEFPLTQLKRNFALLACLLAALTLGLPGPDGAPEAGQGIRVEVNGREIKTDVPPQLVRNQVMVPVRAVAEAFGAWVEWYPQAVPVLDASFQELEERGLFNKETTSLAGVLLRVQKVEFKFGHRIVIEGSKYRSGDGAIGVISTVVYQGRKWKLEDVRITWIS